jgi:hypothetical protein
VELASKYPLPQAPHLVMRVDAAALFWLFFSLWLHPRSNNTPCCVFSCSWILAPRRRSDDHREWHSPSLRAVLFVQLDASLPLPSVDAPLSSAAQLWLVVRRALCPFLRRCLCLTPTLRQWAPCIPMSRLALACGAALFPLLCLSVRACVRAVPGPATS